MRNKRRINSLKLAMVLTLALLVLVFLDYSEGKRKDQTAESEIAEKALKEMAEVREKAETEKAFDANLTTFKKGTREFVVDVLPGIPLDYWDKPISQITIPKGSNITYHTKHPGTSEIKATYSGVTSKEIISLRIDMAMTLPGSNIQKNEELYGITINSIIPNVFPLRWRGWYLKPVLARYELTCYIYGELVTDYEEFLETLEYDPDVIVTFKEETAPICFVECGDGTIVVFGEYWKEWRTREQSRESRCKK